MVPEVSGILVVLLCVCGPILQPSIYVCKSRKLEKRRMHKQKQRANFSAKIESYEDLEARVEHMEALVRGHFDEDPDRAMARAEWEAIPEDSAKKAADARELLRLTKKEEEELQAEAIAAHAADTAEDHGPSGPRKPN